MAKRPYPKKPFGQGGGRQPPRRGGKPWGGPGGKPGPGGGRGRGGPPRRFDRRRPFLPDIIHEDADVLVVFKPPGIEVAGDRSRDDTLIGSLHALRRWRTITPVYRIEREASGLVLIAVSPEARELLSDESRRGRVIRLYHAVVEGDPGEQDATQTIQAQVILHDDRFRRVAGRNPMHERLPLTHTRVLRKGEGCALVQARPETNRRNQVRSHLAEIGTPIAGDREYGASADPLSRLALHLAEVRFTHPGTRKQMKFTRHESLFWKLVGAEPPAGSRQDGDDTSWDHVADWYDDLQQHRRNDHYDEVIIPGTLALLEPVGEKRVLDVACGQGVVSRKLAELGATVLGVDQSTRLLDAARQLASDNIEYAVADMRDLSGVGEAGSFDAATSVMAITNTDPIAPVFEGIARLLKPNGTFVMVLSHPAFRIIGRSSWQWDPTRARQFRRLDAYLTEEERDVQMRPGDDPSVTTKTYHRPLGAYVRALADAGLLVDTIEEWTSKRRADSGPRADEENRMHGEIPLFLAIRARRSS